MRFAESLVNGLNGIRKRLGDSRHREIMGALDEALRGFQNNGDLEGFHGVIESLLVYYYDPMCWSSSMLSVRRLCHNYG